MALVFAFVDIFSRFEDFFKYLETIPTIEEKYRTLLIYADPPSTKTHDYEVILKINSKNPKDIRETLQKIKNYNGVEDLRTLTVVEQVLQA